MISSETHNRLFVIDYSRYLYYEWQARKKPTVDRWHTKTQNGSQDADDKEMLTWFRKIKIVRCRVPRQPNAHDCGVYVVKYAKMVLDAKPRTTEKDLREDLKSQLREDAFTQADVDMERRTILSLIERCASHHMHEYSYLLTCWLWPLLVSERATSR